MENKLELIFNVEVNKNKLKHLTWQEEQKERWNKDLKKVNEIYDKLSFLNNKGIRVEKVCCTEFNQNDASRGFYPYLRLPQFPCIIHPLHNTEGMDFSESHSNFRGTYNYESFIKKITQYIK